MRGLNCYIRAAALCLPLMITGFENPVLAGQQNEVVGFSIKAIQSDKQINKKVSYFDLMLSPGEEHLLEVDIFNTSNSPLKVSIAANTAGTNSGGVIDYTMPNVTDDSLFAPFQDLADVETPSAIVPANSTRRVGIKIKMPNESFDGVMLGGIAVKKTEDKHIAAESNGTSIQNEYCYIIGVKIRENNTEVAPDFRLRHVGPKLSNYHTSIAANLQNYKAAIVDGLDIDAAVYYNNESEPLYTSSNNGFDVAPNSNFDYIIPCSGKLSPGTYRLKLTASSEGKIWEFDESFIVSGASANDINGQAVNLPKSDYYKIATICLALLLMLLLALYIINKVYFHKRKYNKT